MKKLVVLMFLISSIANLYAQGNLVPNPSFELNSGCPAAPAQLYLTNDWKNPTTASPDYYDTCSAIVGVPDNLIGSQMAHSGKAYAGSIIFEGNYTEYIQSQLTDSLKFGKSYCVEYFVSLAGGSEFASIGPQAYFSNDSIRSSATGIFPYSPQIVFGNIIYDTTNWVRISGEFTASGGEDYLTLGNYFDTPNFQYDTVNASPFAHNYSYFYIDDVSVYEKINSNAGVDKVLCLGDSILIGSVAENGITYNWNTASALSDSTDAQPWAKPIQTTTYYLTIADTGNLYCAGSTVDSITITVNDCTLPPVFSVPTILSGEERIIINSLPANTTLELYDERGRLVFAQDQYANDFSIINLSAGIYFYKLHFSDGSEQKGKICVNK
ncbi:hypothetical protein BH09BAC5_BH09BAC5_19580 [soil metagenome]